VRILPFYILRSHLVPFLLGFGVVTFIFEMDVLFDYMDKLINYGVPLGTVTQIFGLSLGFIVALSVPCAVLVAVLMAFGRLSQDNEITALRASGVNLFRVILPVLVAAGSLAAGMMWFNNAVYPEANHRLMNLMVDVARLRPTVRLQEGAFITDFPGYNLLVKNLDGLTNEMHGVTIYQLNPGGPPTTILAEKGKLEYTPDGGTAVLRLQTGEIHEVPADASGPRRYHRLVFKQHTIYIQGAGGMLERTVRSTRTDREMSAAALAEERGKLLDQYAQSLRMREQRFAELGASDEALAALAPERAPLATRVAAIAGALLRRPDPLQRLVDTHPALKLDADLWRSERVALRTRIAGLSIEIHKKFALPVACVVFVLIGAPIGMRVKRGGPAVAFVSIGFFLFYYLCLVGGEELAKRLLLPPWLAMWLANIVLGLWGIDRTLAACDVPAPWRPFRPRAPRPRGAGEVESAARTAAA
jgi:lipopolysaccharide export system permease protein